MSSGDVELQTDKIAEVALLVKPVSNITANTHHGKVAVQWDDLSYSIGPKQILWNTSGKLRSGELCSILGPSGAGKSTLLNVLARRAKGGSGVKKEGKALYFGKKLKAKSRDKLAYVMQEDALLATATPREALMFSARLRLPSSTSRADQTALVHELIAKLGLTDCADTFIGNVTIKGISGGEKKRTAIAVELITKPAVLFLDEPTSGLDSYAAWNVVNTLKELAANDQTAILCTIHQPSSEVFALFSRTILMCSGRILYNGLCQDIATHFTDVHKVTCPDNYNIADFVMFHFQKEKSEKLIEERDTQKLIEDQSNSKDSPTNDNSEDTKENTKQNFPGRAGFCTQLMYLAQREGRQVLRDKASLIARFGSAIFLNLIFACIFYQAGRKTLQTRFGAVTNLMISAMFGSAQPVILVFPLERPIFIREYATGTYGAVPYALSKLLVELPLAFLNTLVVYLVTYWLMELHGNFLHLVLVTTGMSLVSSSTALVLGSLCENVQTASQLTPLIFVPQLLFGGFFIKIADIPSFLRWGQYLCSLKFALNLAMLAEFKDDYDAFLASPTQLLLSAQKLLSPNTNSAAVVLSAEVINYQRSTSVKAFLDSQNCYYDDWYVYLIVLTGLFVMFRVISLFSLKAKASNFS